METKGVGVCLVPNADGIPCGSQIGEGAPIGTVMLGIPPNPYVGHKKCVDAFQFRRLNPVKIAKQAGPGGPAGEYEDALAFGSVPLEKPEPTMSDQKTQALSEVPPIQVWPETAHTNRYVHQVYLALADSTQGQGDPTRIMSIAKRAIIEALGTIQ